MSETNLQLFPGIFRSTVGGENPGFFLHSDGRVGIGNKAPTARPLWSSDDNDRNKLNVSGHTHIDGNLNVTGQLYGDASTLDNVAAVITGSWLTDGAGGPQPADIKYDLGNVGIGGAASTEKLKVHGTVEATVFRSDYQNQDSMDGGAAIAFRNTTTDNYIRFCSNMGTVRSRIGCARRNGEQDENFYVNTIYIGNNTSKGLRSVSGNYGTVQTTGGGSGGWEGYSIEGRYVFMSADNNQCGIYNDIDNEWMIYCERNSYTSLYFNGSRKLKIGQPSTITSSGLRIYGVEANVTYVDHQADWFTNGGSIQTTAPTNANYSLYVDNYIRAAGIAVFSDKRIKRDFVEIDDTFALGKLRQLKPTSYRYIDKTRVTANKVLGFIAQEVAEVLPDAVSITRSVIPNIQTEASIKKIDETKFELTLKEPHPVTVGAILEIKAPDVDHTEVEVISVTNDTTFTIFTDDKDMDIIGDRVWVYGEYVDDFNNLDKNAIWTIATAALQEVDRQLQVEQKKVKSLEERIAALEAIVLN
tara:strand:+ start:1257 stop:2840 length:1584 start_codon:yes stop_codon:yes gene_type:complete